MSGKVEFLELLATALDASSGDSAADFGRAKDVLKVLGKWVVTADLLGQTEAGKKVKKICKHADEDLGKAATACIDAWKECVRLEGVSAKKATAGTPTTPSNPKMAAAGGQAKEGGEASGRLQPESVPQLVSVPSQQDSIMWLASQGSLEDGAGAAAAGGGWRRPPAPPAPLIKPPRKSGDPMRDKIRVLLAEALAMAAEDVSLETGQVADPGEVAAKIEEAMFAQNGGVNPKYKAKYRTLAFNLKDVNNPELRFKVLLGVIPGDSLVNLSAEEIASSDRKQDNDKIRDYKKKECERGLTGQASTDMFKCGKCKQNKTTYYQLQTRSADEPMTTFVQCVNCGNRWKFC